MHKILSSYLKRINITFVWALVFIIIGGIGWQLSSIVLSTMYANAYYFRGNAYSDLKKYEEALADYTEAIELDPKYVNAYDFRGNAYKAVGKNEEAIADYTKAIELAPKDAINYSARGRAYKAVGKNEEAEADSAMAKALGK